MRIYKFAANEVEKDAVPTSVVVGGKGWGLLRMSSLGIPVPPGFVIPAEVCRRYLLDGALPDTFETTIEEGLAHLERCTGRSFGSSSRPLLVSVRSGASVSMPGMMDTVLNVGLLRTHLNEHGVELGPSRFVHDSYRRLLELHCEAGSVADAVRLSAIRAEVLENAGKNAVSELGLDWIRGLTLAYENALREMSRSLPQSPKQQLYESIENVFRSWNNRRARQFRSANGIPDDLGTAVTVQAMVFGNLNDRSGTGVAFSRDPNTGAPGLIGEFLTEAQGEDVVSGRFTPVDLQCEEQGLRFIDNALVEQLSAVATVLETEAGAVQDLEFTVEDGSLWMLQSRDAKLSAKARIRTNVDLAEEGKISRQAAVLNVNASDLNRSIYESVAEDSQRRVIAKGLPASPGVATGVACFSVDKAIAYSNTGVSYILIRKETNIDDLDATRNAVGLLTTHGGMTSHAALVARGMGLCCVTGCAELVIDEQKCQLQVRQGDRSIVEGDLLTLDGTTGEVIEGVARANERSSSNLMDRFLSWADNFRTMSICANADTAEEISEALGDGAEAIGLCCTEHLFLNQNRPDLAHEMVLAFDHATRKKVIEHFAPFQKDAFGRLLKACRGRPLSIRFLDLPIHLLTDYGADRVDLSRIAERLGAPISELQNRLEQLRAHNPLLGHRGCRLGIAFPELYEVQARALFEAYLEGEHTSELSLILPMTTHVNEMRWAKKLVDAAAKDLGRRYPNQKFQIRLGAMVETPRACLIADQLAQNCDFLLFGLNDLTISTFAIDRDDASRYLQRYLSGEIFDEDPFRAIDLDGVWSLVQLAARKARASNPDIRMGLSGAQVTDAKTMLLCSEIGLNYVTCARHRLPVLRLAAGQAQLKSTVSADDSDTIPSTD